ncbi:hypothetical protein EV182_000029 [Spiromyces aspiralis]|uniref:Uncharacterized protein n=1 Tax=Spiromyces aspiralis TaxID=68401 RepID=A0ACC1HK32_9FUNG|nr:hypothetical protein EV182_000029 [Spiromyces aspiralis]
MFEQILPPTAPTASTRSAEFWPTPANYYHALLVEPSKPIDFPEDLYLRLMANPETASVELDICDNVIRVKECGTGSARPSDLTIPVTDDNDNDNDDDDDCDTATLLSFSISSPTLSCSKSVDSLRDAAAKSSYQWDHYWMASRGATGRHCRSISSSAVTGGAIDYTSASTLPILTSSGGSGCCYYDDYCCC